MASESRNFNTHVLSEEERTKRNDRIVELHKQGLLAAQIGIRVGLGRNSVYKILSETKGSNSTTDRP